MTWQIVYIHLPLCDYIIHLSLECRPVCLFWSVSGIMLSVLERSIHMSPIANNQMTALNLNRNSPHDSRDVISKYYDMSQCSSHQHHRHNTTWWHCMGSDSFWPCLCIFPPPRGQIFVIILLLRLSSLSNGIMWSFVLKFPCFLFFSFLFWFLCSLSLFYFLG